MLGIADSQQVIKEQQVLGVGIREPVAHSSRAACGVEIVDAVAARSSRATTWNGTSLVCDSQKVLNTSTPRSTSHRGNLADESALADTRRSYHADHRAVAVDRLVQQALDGGHLPLAPDQIRFARADCAMPSPMPSNRWAATGSSAPLI